MTDFHQPELDRIDPSTAAVLRHILASQQALLAKIEGLDQKLASAFPGDDAEGHRRAHQAMIERTAELRRLRVAIQEKTISALLWSVLVAVGVAVWEAIKEHARR